MFNHLYTVGILILFSAMLPGPDFALVVKNTLLYSRRGGIYTALGISSALMVHVSYCVLGLALVISQSTMIFNLIKYTGAAYLLYLGVKTLLTPVSGKALATDVQLQKKYIRPMIAFRQGFLCNVLNPKASLFFLALFTLVINPNTPLAIQLMYGLEIFLIALIWFSSLSILLSHPKMAKQFNFAEKFIMKALGCFLIFFGIILVLLKH